VERIQFHESHSVQISNPFLKEIAVFKLIAAIQFASFSTEPSFAKALDCKVNKGIGAI